MDKGLRETPKSRIPTDQYRDNWDKIFAGKAKQKEGEKQNGK